MDVVALRDKIIARPEYIAELFESMGFEHIRDKGEYYSFQNIGGDNTNAIAIYKSNLHYENFSHGSQGTLFTLVMETRDCTFPESVKFVAKKLNIQGCDSVKHVVLPFGGFYKNIMRDSSDVVLDMPYYSESQLPPADSLSYKFFCDGVSYQVQKKLGVRYSHEDDAILIPIYNAEHQLVGCKARNNDPNVDMMHRWYMYIPYKKSNVVYGLDENYWHIESHSRAFIFEAEKSVMQSMSFDMKCGLGIGGHNISPAQTKYIKMLSTKKVTVAFDQDLDEEEVRYEASKLKIQDERYQNKVTYIYDRKGEYLPKGSKMSPSDLGKECFVNLLKYCQHEVK